MPKLTIALLIDKGHIKKESCSDEEIVSSVVDVERTKASASIGFFFYKTGGTSRMTEKDLKQFKMVGLIPATDEERLKIMTEDYEIPEEKQRNF